jgi:hypothetical protein
MRAPFKIGSWHHEDHEWVAALILQLPSRAKSVRLKRCFVPIAENEDFAYKRPYTTPYPTSNQLRGQM